MPIIEANDLTKIYRVSQKNEGMLGALRGLYRREYKEVRAVDGVRFSIEPGVYLPGFGVRSEVNMHWTSQGPVVTPADPQRELIVRG